MYINHSGNPFFHSTWNVW